MRYLKIFIPSILSIFSSCNCYQEFVYESNPSYTLILIPQNSREGFYKFSIENQLPGTYIKKRKEILLNSTISYEKYPCKSVSYEIKKDTFFTVNVTSKMMIYPPYEINNDEINRYLIADNDSFKIQTIDTVILNRRPKKLNVLIDWYGANDAKIVDGKKVYISPPYTTTRVISEDIVVSDTSKKNIINIDFLLEGDLWHNIDYNHDTLFKTRDGLLLKKHNMHYVKKLPNKPCLNKTNSVEDF